MSPPKLADRPSLPMPMTLARGAGLSRGGMRAVIYSKTPLSVKEENPVDVTPKEAVDVLQNETVVVNGDAVTKDAVATVGGSTTGDDGAQSDPTVQESVDDRGNGVNSAMQSSTGVPMEVDGERVPGHFLEMPLEVPRSQQSFDQSVLLEMTSTPVSKRKRDGARHKFNKIRVMESAQDTAADELNDLDLDATVSENGKKPGMLDDGKMETIGTGGDEDALELSKDLFEDEDDVRKEGQTKKITVIATPTKDDELAEENGGVAARKSPSEEDAESVDDQRKITEEESESMHVNPLEEFEGLARKAAEEVREWATRTRDNLGGTEYDFVGDDEPNGRTVQSGNNDLALPKAKKDKRLRVDRRGKEQPEGLDEESVEEARKKEEERLSQAILNESLRVRAKTKTKNPPETKRRSSKIIVHEERNAEIVAKRERISNLAQGDNLKRAAIKFEQNAKILLAVTAKTGQRDAEEDRNAEKHHEVSLNVAKQRLEESRKREAERPCAKKDKYNALEKQYQDDLLLAKQRSLATVKKSLLLINVHSCTFSDSCRKPDDLAILDIVAAILEKDVSVKDLVVTAAKIQDSIVVVDGVNRVHAFRELSKMLHERHGDVYESGETHSVRESFTQVDNPACVPRAPASQPIAGSKTRNPYSMILAEVVESAPMELGGAEFGALLKANMASRGTPVAKLERAINRRKLAKSFDLDRAYGRTVADHLKQLHACHISCDSKEILFLRTLDEGIESLLKTTIEAKRDEKLLNNDFLHKFTHARKVCKHTAETVILLLADGEIEVDEALQMIADHSTKIFYALCGRQCPPDNAKTVQDRLEGGLRTYRTINWHVQTNRRLDHASMSARDYNPELLLLEIERLRSPFAVGFVKPTIISLPEVNPDATYLHRCVLNVIDIEDFNDKYDSTFVKSLAGTTDVVYIIVHRHAGTTGPVPVVNVSELVRAGNLPVTLPLKRIVKEDGSDDYSMHDHAHEALIVGGSRQNAWRPQQIEKFLAEYTIRNTLNNEQLRRLMYQTKKPNDETREENKYNLTYVHSNSPVVIDIVANMALNRVATSLVGEELDTFKKDLEEAQLVRTMYGNTIADPPVKLPSNKEKDGERGTKTGKRGQGKRPRPEDLLIS